MRSAGWEDRGDQLALGEPKAEGAFLKAPAYASSFWGRMDKEYERPSSRCQELKCGGKSQGGKIRSASLQRKPEKKKKRGPHESPQIEESKDHSHPLWGGTWEKRGYIRKRFEEGMEEGQPQSQKRGTTGGLKIRLRKESKGKT